MDIEALLARALELHQAGDVTLADEVYRQILGAHPDQPDALHLSGVIALGRGDIGGARRAIERAIERAPDVPDFHNSLANVLKAEGDRTAAEAAYRRALAADRDFADAHYNLALLLESGGAVEDAEHHFAEAVRAKPDLAAAHNALGRVLLRQERFADAVGSFGRVLDLDPEFSDAHNGLGFAAEKSRRLEAAIGHYRAAVRIDPKATEALGNLGNALHAGGRADEAIGHLRDCLALDPGQQTAWDRYLFALPFGTATNRSTLFAANRQWGKRIEADVGGGRRDFANDRDPERRLRVGYISNELYSHLSAFFFEPVLDHHDRDHFEIVCYSTTDKVDDVTRSLAAKADLWRDIQGSDGREAARIIAADGLDILVGVTNFLAANRIVLAHKPAPVIVSYMNQVSTTGLAAVDYLITNEYLIPEGDAEGLFTEKLVRLTDFNTYLPPADPVTIDPAPLAGRGHVTFGSFNNAAKIGAPVIAVWSRILAAVPGARLKLVSPIFDDASMRDRCLRLFGDAGVAEADIEIKGRIGGRARYLGEYNSVDIGLDPFPFSGGTVNYEALYMGVPVISLAGATEMCRMGLSLLSRVGLDDLVANSTEQYVAKAIALALDADRITALKSEIRGRAEATIFAAGAHVGELENAYRTMWRDYCRK